MNKKIKPENKKERKLKGWKKVESFLGVEMWVKGKKRRFYCLIDKTLVHSFTEKSK